MKLNKYILQILEYLTSINNLTINNQLCKIEDSFKLHLDENNHIEISKNSLKINNQNIEEKILSSSKHDKSLVDLNNVSNFITSIAKEIIGINHFGISYSCRNIKNELLFYKKLLLKTSIKLYEEKSDSKHSRWFFIGNLEKNHPLFEIVLTELSIPICNDWIPHFQIDFNTILDYKKIVIATESLLTTNFISWKLDIPNYGVVLCMGKLGSIDNTKITLGIGTNRRGKQIFKEVF